MKKYKATDPEMVQAQKDLAEMSNLSDRVITNDKDLFDCGHNWYAKNHNDLIQKLESFTNQTLCFIEYQISIKNPISCIDTL